ncbi:DUF1501 domain-containing protein [Limibacter armeniacum]|uniref:DUF1501 domain-containing protein n=1 Tax=Limibacter armeniacum TaxID=466084 RepID=UPI002FE6B2F9
MLGEQKNSRRQFLKQSAIVASGSLLLPSFLKASPNSNTVGNRLVVIQLSGGNDGLNTVIPFRNDILIQNRPNLLQHRDKLLKLTDEVALNPVMKGLGALYDQGDLCILNSVGYPNPNRSHFRSMDIWHTASESDEYLTTGWLGRYLDRECPDAAPVTAVEMGNVLSMAMKGKSKKGIPLVDVQQFYKSSKRINNAHAYEGENPMAAYLYKTQADVKSSAAYLFEKNKIYKSKKSYPDNQFGNQLREVAEMIISGVESPVYYVSLSGFDTHNNQQGRQERLLKIYSDAIKVFTEDLKAANCWNDTLVMTFSEFGRRVKENGSRGTDHGKANNLFLMGGKLKQQGLYNAMPDLMDLDSGDVRHKIDFREVYASILNNWMHVDAKRVIGKGFSQLDFV